MIKILRSILLVCSVFLAFTAQGQKLKNKDVKRALEDGKASGIEIITSDQFTPEVRQEMDLKVTFQDGTSVLASDYSAVWDKTECSVVNAGWKIKGELLSNGKGLIVPNMLPLYYMDKNVIINMELLGIKSTKTLTANFCIQNYTITREGRKGTTGTRGYNGREGTPGDDGQDGDRGENGPDLDVRIEEETIAEKVYMVIILEDQKYLLDPSCSTVQIISQGGNGGKGGRGGDGGDSPRSGNDYTKTGGRGGEGGDGGNGGNGGNITVRGDAVQKYKAKITFLSVSGKPGDGGDGGSRGLGRPNGTSGSDGHDGYKGSEGQIIFK